MGFTVCINYKQLRLIPLSASNSLMLPSSIVIPGNVSRENPGVANSCFDGSSSANPGVFSGIAVNAFFLAIDCQ